VAPKSISIHSTFTIENLSFLFHLVCDRVKDQHVGMDCYFMDKEISSKKCFLSLVYHSFIHLILSFLHFQFDASSQFIFNLLNFQFT